MLIKFPNFILIGLMLLLKMLNLFR